MEDGYTVDNEGDHLIDKIDSGLYKSRLGERNRNNFKHREHS